MTKARLTASAQTTADLGLMRELNKSIVLNLIRAERSISRADIAKLTNLSRSTVSNIMTELIDENIVQESGAGASHGGRRPIMVNFNYQAGYVIGIDLGTTQIIIVFTNLEGEIFHELRETLNISDGPEISLDKVYKLIRRGIKETGIELNQIIGIGLGVPGPLNHLTGSLVAPPTLPGWHGFPLRSSLANEFGIATYLDNDANLGALGERWRGNGLGYDNLVYIEIGTGIGCGLIMAGRIFRGDIGSAGEIGHLMIDEDGPPCRCGSFGCLESMASGPAIVNRACLAILVGQNTALAKRDLATLNVQDIVEFALAGDLLAQQLIFEAGRHIGVAVANLINLLNPGIIIIGGDVMRAGDLMLGSIRQAAQSRGLQVALEHTRIVKAKLGSEIIAVGAATLVLLETFKSPELNIMLQL